MMHDRFVLTRVPYVSPNLVNDFSVNHRITMTDDGNGVAELLLQQFKQAGFPFVQIVKQEVPDETDVWIALEGLQRFDDDKTAMLSNREIFAQAKALANRFTEKGGIFITVQPTTRAALFSAGQAGLTKTAAQEWTRAHCLTIEIETEGLSNTTIAERLAQHILQDNRTNECLILSDGNKTVPQLCAMPTYPSTHALPIDRNAVLVVSGGGRGITAACLQALAKEYKPRIILLGRTPLKTEPACTKLATTSSEIMQALLTEAKRAQVILTPAQLNQQVSQILAQRDIQQTIAFLNEAGQCAYFAVDILDLAALQQTLTEVRKQFGPITGVIHGAGVLADKLIAQKTLEQFDQVFNTKVVGLKNLLLATKTDPLALLFLFSSVAARFGNVGQCDYAIANDILNKVAEFEYHARHKKCLVKSFNWGPWETGMVTPELKAVFKKRGIDLLSVERGTQLFMNELKDLTSSAVQVVLGSRLEDPMQKERVITVSHENYSFLSNHQVDDAPVLPAVLVLDWFYRMVEAFSYDGQQGKCCHFKVLSGVRLLNFYTSGDPLKVVAEHKTEENRIQLKLVGATGALHYSAEWIAATPPPNACTLPSHLATIASPWPWSLQEIYQPQRVKRLKHQLFHGRQLQAIRALSVCTSQGGRGELWVSTQKKWANPEYKTDVLLLDGVLQLLRLWSFTQLNYPTLPTKITEVVLLKKLQPSGLSTLQCTFSGLACGKYRTLSDVWLHDEQGQCYAWLGGVEMCAVQID